MPRPTNKKELIELSEVNFNKLLEFIDGLPDEIKTKTYKNDELNERDKTVSDVICHLHEWHSLKNTLTTNFFQRKNIRGQEQRHWAHTLFPTRQAITTGA